RKRRRGSRAAPCPLCGSAARGPGVAEGRPGAVFPVTVVVAGNFYCTLVASGLGSYSGVSRGNGPRHPPRGTAPGPDRKEPAMRTTAVVTVEHVYQLIEARYEAMPVIAEAKNTIFVVPETVAEH